MANEGNFIDVCLNYRKAVKRYNEFHKLAKKAAAIGKVSYIKVPEYLEAYKESWKILDEKFSIYDPNFELYDEIEKLQRYQISLESFNEFTEPYRKKLYKDEKEFYEEVEKWGEKMKEAYDEAVEECDPEDRKILSYHIVKDFFLENLCGLK